MPLAIISVFMVFFAWTKRFLIVVPTQFNPTFPIQNVPESWHYYHPTYYEIVITIMTVAIILLLISLFSRFFPIVPVWESAKERGFENGELLGEESKDYEQDKK